MKPDSVLVRIIVLSVLAQPCIMASLDIGSTDGMKAIGGSNRPKKMVDVPEFFIPSGTRNEIDRRTHIERINDWPGSDASGEGTARWHPSGTQDPRLNEYGVLDDGAASAEDHAAETEPASDAAEPAVETQADAPDGDVTAPAERDGAK